MVILQSSTGVIVRDEWESKPDVVDLSCIEDHWTAQHGVPMVAVNMYYVEE